VEVSYKSKLLMLVLLSISIVAISFSAQAQPQGGNGTGSFDIEKVRRAVSEQPMNVDTTTAKASSAGPEKENIGFLVLRIAFYLLIVIAVILLISWMIRKTGLAGRSKIGGVGSMDILEVLPLGANRSVMLVRVTDRVYLLSQTQNSINVLDKIEGDKAVELIATTKSGVSISQFKDVFNSFMEKIKHN
jgi:flagellar biosynthetic protein FliO